MNKVVYIPEHNGLDDKEDVRLDCLYTRADIEQMCQDTKYTAEELIESCDWQHPSTLLDEWIMSDLEMEEGENI